MKGETICDDGELLHALELSADTVKAQRKKALNFMDRLESIRKVEGVANFTVTAGSGNDRLLFLSKPIEIVLEPEITEGVQRRTIRLTFVAASQWGYYSFTWERETDFSDWRNELSETSEFDRPVLAITKAISTRSGKLNNISVSWKNGLEGYTPQLCEAWPKWAYPLYIATRLAGKSREQLTLLRSLEQFPVELGARLFQNAIEEAINRQDDFVSTAEHMESMSAQISNEPRKGIVDKIKRK